MGHEQSTTNKSPPISQMAVPDCGYRVINLNASINSEEFKLNIMTDYVIGQDPRFIDFRKMIEQDQGHVQFNVFSILDYRVRKVQIPIKKHAEKMLRKTDSIHSNNNQNEMEIQMEEQKNHEHILNSKKQFSLGINFKFYPKINDTILRISKVFKNSPLQLSDIKKDQYIVGVVQGDFTSMKSFVDLIKLLIESQFQYVTIAVCDSDGTTRLHKIAIKQLQKWKQSYGVGYLGVELAEGWLNKWQLKKHIDSNKKKLVNNKSGNLKQVEKVSALKDKTVLEQTKSEEVTSISKHDEKIIAPKQQVDFFKQSYQDSPDKQKQPPSITQITQEKTQNPAFSNNQEVKLSLELKQNKNPVQPSHQIEKKQLQTSQILSKPIQNTINQIPDQSNSEISSNQIEEKCNDLQQGNFEGKKRQMSVIKKSKNIIQINFKDDASTICMCKDYSKHCEKCFKEKQGNFYFFNKKTNRIILIDKNMLFPKKN